MNCKKCNYQLAPEDKFCKACGTAIEKTEVNNNPFSSPTELPMPKAINNNEPLLSIPNLGTSITPNEPNIPLPKTENIIQQPVNTSATTPIDKQVISTIKTKNNNLNILIITLIIIIVGILCFFLGKSLNKIENDCLDTNNTNNSNTTDNEDNKDEEPNLTSTNYKVNFKNFELTISNDLVYEIENNSLYIGNDTLTWVAEINIEDIMYANIVTNKDSLKAYYETQNLIVGTYEEKVHGNTTFLTFEISTETDKGIFAYTTANSKYSFTVFAYNNDNTFDYTILNKISSILSSATLINRSKASSINNQIKVPDINQVIK